MTVHPQHAERIGPTARWLTSPLGHMGFQYREQGARAAVIKHLQEFKELQPDGKTPAKDQTQCDAVKAFAISEINALPTEFTGVLVQIDATVNGPGRIVNVTVMGQKLRL